MKNQQGSITIMASVMFLVLILLAGTMVDVTNAVISYSKSRRAVDTATHSMLANYNQELKDQYGLFSYNEEKQKENLEESIKKMLVPYENLGEYDFNLVTEESNGDVIDNVNNKLIESKLDGVWKQSILLDESLDSINTKLSDDFAMSDYENVRKQIHEYMKYRAPLELVEGFLSKIDLVLKSTRSAKVMGDKIDLDKELKETLKNISDIRFRIDGWEIDFDKHPEKGFELNGGTFIKKMATEFDRASGIGDAVTLSTEKNYITDFRLPEVNYNLIKDKCNGSSLYDELILNEETILKTNLDDYIKYYAVYYTTTQLKAEFEENFNEQKLKNQLKYKIEDVEVKTKSYKSIENSEDKYTETTETRKLSADEIDKFIDYTIGKLDNVESKIVITYILDNSFLEKYIKLLSVAYPSTKKDVDLNTLEIFIKNYVSEDDLKKDAFKTSESNKKKCLNILEEFMENYVSVKGKIISEKTKIVDESDVNKESYKIIDSLDKIKPSSNIYEKKYNDSLDAYKDEKVKILKEIEIYDRLSKKLIDDFDGLKKNTDALESKVNTLDNNISEQEEKGGIIEGTKDAALDSISSAQQFIDNDSDSLNKTTSLIDRNKKNIIYNRFFYNLITGDHYYELILNGELFKTSYSDVLYTKGKINEDSFFGLGFEEIKVALGQQKNYTGDSTSGDIKYPFATDMQNKIDNEVNNAVDADYNTLFDNVINDISQLEDVLSDFTMLSIGNNLKISKHYIRELSNYYNAITLDLPITREYLNEYRDKHAELAGSFEIKVPDKENKTKEMLASESSKIKNDGTKNDKDKDDKDKDTKTNSNSFEGVPKTVTAVREKGSFDIFSINLANDKNNDSELFSNSKMPTEGSEEDAAENSMTALGSFGDTLSALSDLGLGLRNRIYENEYLLNKFDYKTKGSYDFLNTSNNEDEKSEIVFDRFKYDEDENTVNYEIEYILNKRVREDEDKEDEPSKYYVKDKENYEVFIAKIFGIRLALNFIHLMSSPSKRAITFQIATAIAGWWSFGLGVPIMQVVLSILWSTLESSADVLLLGMGERVAFYKGPADWYTDLDGGLQYISGKATEAAILKGAELLSQQVKDEIDEFKKGADYKDMMESMNGYIDDIGDFESNVKGNLKTYFGGQLNNFIDESVIKWENANQDKIEAINKYIDLKIKESEYFENKEITGEISIKEEIEKIEEEYELDKKTIEVIEKITKEYINKRFREEKEPQNANDNSSKSNNSIEWSKIDPYEVIMNDTGITDAFKLQIGNLNQFLKNEFGKLEKKLDKIVKSFAKSGGKIVGNKVGELAKSIDKSMKKTIDLSKDSIDKVNEIAKSYPKFSYKDYLRLFLLVMDPEEKIERAMDIIQINMGENFKIVDQNAGLSGDIEIKTKSVFRFIKLIPGFYDNENFDGYTFKFNVQESY